MTKRLIISFSVLLLCIVATPSYALFGGKVDAFSADNVEIDSNGRVISSAKIYVTKDAIRIDGLPGAGKSGGPKINLSLLMLKKQKKTYFYNHDKKLVFEAPAEEEDFSAGYKAMGDIESEKVLGKEKVSGYKCVKKEVVTSIAVMGQTIKNKLIVWESDKFEIPLRTMDEDGAMQEVRNIKTGKPSKKIFKPMSGYKQVGSMMAVMGMDFGAMMEKGRAMEEEKEEPSPQNLENMDVNQMMEQMSQAMGDTMSPEQKEQMMQAMAQAMNQAKQVKKGQGAAKELWGIIPRKPGDRIGYEMKIRNMLDVILGTNSTLQQVFDFYGKKLVAKGWKKQSAYIENGQGMMSMRKGDATIMFALADKPTDMKGTFKLYYNVHYTGAY